MSALLLAAPRGAAAQTTRGSIGGTVRDVQGAAIPGATVTVISTRRNDSLTVITNEAGDFDAQRSLKDQSGFGPNNGQIQFNDQAFLTSNFVPSQYQQSAAVRLFQPGRDAAGKRIAIDPTPINLAYENGQVVRTNGFGAVTSVRSPRVLQLLIRFEV